MKTRHVKYHKQGFTCPGASSPKKRVTLMSLCFGSLALKPLMMFPNDSAVLPPPSDSLQPAEGVLTFQGFTVGEP